MHIQLFNPPVHHYSGVRYRMNPALGLPILAQVLHAAGHTVRVTDLEAIGITPAQLGQALAARDLGPDAIGFTVTTHNSRGARECVQALRTAGYQGYIALGGPHVTLLCHEDADAELADWGADGWVMGEAEGNVVGVFTERQTGRIMGQRIPIEDVPAPLWEQHTPRPTTYDGNQPAILPPESISMWSRGCPHPCTFCGNPVYHQQRIRFRPAPQIAAEMAALKGLGVKTVFVYDDELIGASDHQAEWMREVCAPVAPLGLLWKGQGRCSQQHVDLETLQAMHAAGCRVIMWGVESFSPKVLDAMRKGITPDDIWHTLSAARQAGIANWLFLMVGNYGETPDDLALTERELRRACRAGLVQYRQVTVCTPVRGSPLYDMAKTEGWLVENPETGPQMGQSYAATPWLSREQIAAWRSRLEVVQ